MFDTDNETDELAVIKAAFIGKADAYSEFFSHEGKLLLAGEPAGKSSWYGADLAFVVAEGGEKEEISRFKAAIEAAQEAGLLVCAVLVADKPISVSAPLLVLNPADYTSSKEIGEEIYGMVKIVNDTIAVPGLVNLDLRDIQALLDGKERCFFAKAIASGKRATCTAAKQVTEHLAVKYADARMSKSVIINVVGSEENINMYEVNEATSVIAEWLENDDCNVLWGASTDESLGEQVEVYVLLAF